MFNKIVSFSILIPCVFWLSCEDENEMNEESQSTYHFDLIYEDTGITKDENDYYHLTIDRDNWQTLYRVRGTVYKDNQLAEFMKFY